VVARFARQNPRIQVVALPHRTARVADVDAFFRKHLAGSGVRLQRDPRGAIARSYGIQYYPHFVALDAKRRLIGNAYSLVPVLAQARFGSRG
jgi:hypothetical protein